LNLSPFQRQKFKVDVVSELYPEYYILKVNDFKGEPGTPLEEWIYYLSTGDIPKDSTAPGLEEARKKLELALMSKEELSAYYRHLDNTVILKDNIYTSRGEGLLEGREMGRKEGLQEGMEKGMERGRKEGIEEGMKKGMEEGMKKAKMQIVTNLMLSGTDIELVMEVTGMTKEEIDNLRINN